MKLGERGLPLGPLPFFSLEIDLKRWVLCDFETASDCDLKLCGAWRYAEDPTTEILCLGYTIMGDTPTIWRPGAPAGDLYQLATDPETIFIAHNVAFEKAIWRAILTPVYGIPDVPNERWHDTMAVCAEKTVPLKLEEAAKCLDLGLQKDLAGSRLTVSLSKPRKDGSYDRSPETLQKVYDYNRTDLAAEVALHQRLGWLEPGERRVWLMDQRVNERGIRIDRDFIRAAQKVVDGAIVPATRRFREITGVNPAQRDLVLKWLKGQGTDLKDLKKETIDDILGWNGEGKSWDDISSPVREALEIRAAISSASIKKLPRMEATICSDGRARGLLQYHGAGPGRWAGRLFQPQNFPRGRLGDLDAGLNELGKPVAKKVPVDTIVSAIMSGDQSYVQAVVGDPIDTVVSGLRHSLLAANGTTFLSGDFSGIEARIVLALAGQHDKTALMASGVDIYCDMASSIYNHTVTKADVEERQDGKSGVLGLGFQMGDKKFHDRYCPDKPMEFATQVVETYRRAWAPLVPKLWYGLEEAATAAVWSRQPTMAYGVTYAMERDWLTALLPSGRKLWYFQAAPAKVQMPWDPSPSEGWILLLRQEEWRPAKDIRLRGSAHGECGPGACPRSAG